MSFIYQDSVFKYCTIKEIVMIQNIGFNSIADIFSIRC